MMWHIDVIRIQHHFSEGVLENLIGMLGSTLEWTPFGDRESIDWLDMRDPKSGEFVAKMIDHMCNSIMLLSLKLQDLVRFVRMKM